MRKAKSLEQEMLTIKQAKIDVVVKQFEQQLLRAAKQDAAKQDAKRKAQQDLNFDLRMQISERQEKNRLARVRMPANEMAMNAKILQQYSPARQSPRSTLQRTGNNIIF